MPKLRTRTPKLSPQERKSSPQALSLPRSFPAKAFKYLNRRANEFLGGKSSWKFHFLEVRVVFILPVLAGFSIFWSGSTSWICFRLFSVLRRLDFWRQQTLFPWECRREPLPASIRPVNCWVGGYSRQLPAGALFAGPQNRLYGDDTTHSI